VVFNEVKDWCIVWRHIEKNATRGKLITRNANIAMQRMHTADKGLQKEKKIIIKNIMWGSVI